MWYLWLIVGLGAIIIFIKRYDGSRNRSDSGFDFDWISDSDSDGGGDSGGGDGGGD